MRSRGRLNSRSTRREFQGVLIRVGDGFGCIHPWPELGDAPLEAQLDALSRGVKTPLIEAALECVAVDAEARRQGVDLFDGLEVPRSHASLSLAGAIEQDCEAACAAGFERVKVKMGSDPEREFGVLRGLMQQFPGLSWRIDFNQSQSLDVIRRQIHALGDVYSARLEFLEDAYLSGEVPEPGWRLPMAIDREVEQPPFEAEIRVLKPAVNRMAEVLRQAEASRQQVVVTSYMDHPLGQSYAAWQAGQAAQLYPERVLDGGLITHGLFEADAFGEALGKPSPVFQPASGEGLGFGNLLESLAWKKWS